MKSVFLIIGIAFMASANMPSKLFSAHIESRVFTLYGLPDASEESLARIESLVINSQKIYATSEFMEYDEQNFVFFKSLANAGTESSIAYLLNQVEKENFGPEKIVVFLKLIQESPYHCQRIAEILADFAQSKLSLRHPAIRQSAWIAFWTVVRRAVFIAETPLYKEYLGVNGVSPLKLMSKQWKKAENTYEKILALKTFPDAGAHVSIADMERVFLGEMNYTTIHIDAIDSLRMLSLLDDKETEYSFLKKMVNAHAKPSCVGFCPYIEELYIFD